MKTLVYFASGKYRKKYQELPFDRIYLIDNCFKSKLPRGQKFFTEGKITCIGMDCLDSIAFLKTKGAKIDCFVSLNEGLYEGGGRYAINSDMFLGYAMSLFKDEYIHIMNKSYYCNMYHVSMDLPYIKEEINKEDKRYLSPFIFSKGDYHTNNAKIYCMKNASNCFSKYFKNGLCLNVIHDSIWNYYNNLGKLILSFTDQGQGNFFNKKQKIIHIKETSFTDILKLCVEEKIDKIGFTPWARGHYNWIIEKLKNYKHDYPNEISLFHLNSNDYSELKTLLLTKR